MKSTTFIFRGVSIPPTFTARSPFLSMLVLAASFKLFVEEESDTFKSRIEVFDISNESIVLHSHEHVNESLYYIILLFIYYEIPTFSFFSFVYFLIY